MIVILIVVTTFARLEEEVSRYHFKNGASETPNVCRGVVVGANNDLWGSVLASLNLRREVVVSPAPVTHVTDFDLHVVADLRPTLGLLLSILAIFALTFILVALIALLGLLVVLIRNRIPANL
jgi:hypothetical protein